MSDQQLLVRKAIEIVSTRFNVTTYEAEIRLAEAIAAGKIHVTVDPKCKQELIDAATARLPPQNAIKPDDALAALAEAARQGALAHHMLILCGTVSQGELLNWLDSFGEPEFKPAPVEIIREEIRAVYADPACGKPSYRDLPNYVQPRLKARGFEASGRQIQEIGREAEFKPLRRKQGYKKGT